MKVWMPNGTKKLREVPQTMKALTTLIKASLKDAEQEHRIWYQDESEDWITIADDDDLQLAYETAQNHFKGNLKVFVKPVEAKSESTKAKAKVAKKEEDSSSSDADANDDDKEFDLMKSMIQETIKK